MINFNLYFVLDFNSSKLKSNKSKIRPLWDTPKFHEVGLKNLEGTKSLFGRQIESRLRVTQPEDVQHANDEILQAQTGMHVYNIPKHDSDFDSY